MDDVPARIARAIPTAAYRPLAFLHGCVRCIWQGSIASQQRKAATTTLPTAADHVRTTFARARERATQGQTFCCEHFSFFARQALARTETLRASEGGSEVLAFQNPDEHDVEGGLGHNSEQKPKSGVERAA